MARQILRPPIVNRPPAIRIHGYLDWGLVVLVMPLSLACRPKTSSEASHLFPNSSDLQGWTKSSETRTFPADRLYEYIDGDAEKYIRAGVEQTLTSDYRFGDKIEAVADVFIMSTAAGATAVYESQPATGSEPVDLGDAARLYKGNLSLRKGRYYVRIVAFQEVPEGREALLALGRAIASKLP